MSCEIDVSKPDKTASSECKSPVDPFVRAYVQFLVYLVQFVMMTYIFVKILWIPDQVLNTCTSKDVALTIRKQRIKQMDVIATVPVHPGLNTALSLHAPFVRRLHMQVQDGTADVHSSDALDKFDPNLARKRILKLDSSIKIIQYCKDSPYVSPLVIVLSPMTLPEGPLFSWMFFTNDARPIFYPNNPSFYNLNKNQLYSIKDTCADTVDDLIERGHIQTYSRRHVPITTDIRNTVIPLTAHPYRNPTTTRTMCIYIVEDPKQVGTIQIKSGVQRMMIWVHKDVLPERQYISFIERSLILQCNPHIYHWKLANADAAGLALIQELKAVTQNLTIESVHGPSQESDYSLLGNKLASGLSVPYYVHEKVSMETLEADKQVILKQLSKY